jgi:O-antigen ligase
MRSEYNRTDAGFSGEITIIRFVPYVIGGILGFILLLFPLHFSFWLVIGSLALFYFFVRPEYSFYLFFFSIIILTEAIPQGIEADGIFALRDIDSTRGAPSILLLYFLVMFGMYFFKLYFIDKGKTVVSFKYLIVWLMILLAAAVTGIERGWDYFEIRGDFMKLLFPVLCFYLSVNVLNDQNKIHNILLIMFIACVIKSSMLVINYLTGHGLLFLSGERTYRLATYDSGDLLAFITLVLLSYTIVLGRTVTGRRGLVLILGTIPMLFALMFSFRRAHWVGMLVSLGIVFLLFNSIEKRRMLYSFFIVLWLIPFVYVGLRNYSTIKEEDITALLTRFSSIIDGEQNSNVYHILESEQALKDIIQNPMMGLGLGAHHSPIWGYEDDRVPTSSVHNTWIFLWMKTGLCGLLFFIWVGIKYIREILVSRDVNCNMETRAVVIAISSTVGLWLSLFLTMSAMVLYHLTFLIALFSSIIFVLIGKHKH